VNEKENIQEEPKRLDHEPEADAETTSEAVVIDEADAESGTAATEEVEAEEDAVPATFANVKLFSDKKKNPGRATAYKKEEKKNTRDAGHSEKIGAADTIGASGRSAKKNADVQPTRRAIFDGFTLKMIAVVTMLIDHTAAALLDGTWKEADFGDPVYTIYQVMRVIGRFAFPLFCFMLVEGFFHTRSRKKYAIRLAAFALLSEVPFDLAFSDRAKPFSERVMDWSHQNVFLTLLIGFLVIWGIEWWLRPWIARKKAPKTFTEISKFFLPMLGFVILGGLAAVTSNCDYGVIGIVVIVFIYFSHGEKHPGMNMIRSGILLTAFASRTSAIILAGYPLTEFYSEKRGRSMKWFFYVFYPAHLLVLFLLKEYVL